MQYIRRRQLATRYQVTTRTIDRMIEDGRLPPPDLYNGKAPLWSDEKIEANERAAAARRLVPSNRVREIPSTEQVATK